MWRWADLDPVERGRLLRRDDPGTFLDTVRPLVEAVRTRGDAAVARLTEEFDGVHLPPERFRVPEEELAAAGSALPGPVRQALERSVERVRAFHRRQQVAPVPLSEVEPGVWVGEQVRPVDSVGLYVPRGKGAFPSVMVMLGVPATVAGVPRIVVATPPGPGGAVDPATLHVAHLLGIREVYRVGGVQAVAALAYGTETIPRVHKIVGPGSTYVTAAKRLLQGLVDTGLPAGASEALVLADGSADPRVAALDFLNEAEHGPDSSVYLVTPSQELANRVLAELPGLVARLPAWRREFVETVLTRHGGIVVTPDLAAAVEFANAYAPEHVVLLVKEPWPLLEQIRNAGEVVIGPHASLAMANYGVGPNHVLPTGGFAHAFSPLSIRDFLKVTSVVYATRGGAARVHPDTLALAEYEGFAAHALAVRERPLLADAGGPPTPAP